jgi:regulatory protein
LTLEEPEKIRQVLRRRAMDLLARREHTRHELSTKLTTSLKKSQRQRIASDPQENVQEDPHNEQLSIQQGERIFAQVLVEVLDKLEHDKLLSDSRFAESYVNGRINRGYGPVYIRHQLRQKRVDHELLDSNLEQLDQQQWIEQLSVLIKRRVGDAGLPARGSKEHSKLQRFILSRGYTVSQWCEVEKSFV